MKTVDGYAMSSRDRGYGDFAMHPDMDTLRTAPPSWPHRGKSYVANWIGHSLLCTGRVKPLLRRIRNEMTAAGLSVESTKGEWGTRSPGAPIRVKRAPGQAGGEE